MNTKNYVRVEYIAATGRYEASIPTKTGTLTLGNHFLDALSAALAHDIGFIANTARTSRPDELSDLLRTTGR